MAEGNRPILPDEAILGFKKSDFTSADRVLGQDVRIDELPEGIRFYIKGQSFDVAGKRIVVNLYELFPVDGGLKLRKDHLEKFLNKIPDEEEIALKYGPCAADSEGYFWIAKWRDAAGTEKGVMSDTIRVSEKWRARYEAYQRKVNGGPDTLHAPALPAAPASVPAPQTFGPMDMIRFMQEGEDRALRNMERMAVIMKGNQPAMPEAVLVKAYEAAGDIVGKAMENNLATMRKANKAVQQAVDDLGGGAAGGEGDDGAGGEGDDDGAGAPGDAVMPAWLAPFIPMVQPWLEKLLGGGATGAAVKTLIVSSDEWKEIFTDKEKFGQAVSAMEQHFGSEVTQRAMDVLLNRRKDKKKGK